MTYWRRTRTLLAAAAMLAAALSLPRAAEAHGHGVRGGYVGHGGPVVVRGFYGFPYAYPYYSFGLGFGPYWGPYWGPWGYGGYGPPGGIDMSAAFSAGYGAIDLNVKPGAAEVWVDGKFVAEAKDLDGYPSYLWLSEGAHKLIVYKGGYARFEEEVEVQRGLRKELKVRLEKGDSESPGQRPGKAEPGKAEPAKTDTTKIL
jgi:PEGA domain